jgi:hypothetical protein
MSASTGPAPRLSASHLYRFVAACPPAAAGLALLWASFCVGCIAIYLGNFSDEGDVLAVGLALSRGSVLYRDLFSHHFPFAYYWVAAALWLLGPSILAARLSLLLLQLVVFAILMRALRAPIPLGLAAVAWSATRHLFIAHMVTYDAFEALALAAVFGLALGLLAGWARPTTWLWVVIGLFSALCALNDPLNAVPIGLTFIILALRPAWWRGLLLAGAMVLMVLAGYGGYLYVSGSRPDFYRDVVLFNTQVYGRYDHFNLQIYALEIRGALSSAQNLFEPANWLGVSAYSPNAHLPVTLQWLLGGFLQRVALLGACLALLWRRKWRAAALGYVFPATLLPRGDVYLHVPAFMLVTYVAAAGLLRLSWPGPGWGRLGWPGPWWRSARAWLMAAALGLVVWPIGLGLGLLVRHIGSYGYATNFQGYEDLAAHLNALDCGRGAALGYYPGDPTVYFFTGRQPISKYEYLWPWVADVALPEVLSHLSQDEAIVYLQPVPSVWDIPTAVYLADLNRYVTSHYVRAGDDYLSPQLAARCPPPASH